MAIPFTDTPFNRQHILQMTPEQLEAHVAEMRVKRMAAQRHYEEVVAAKAKLKEEKSIERYKKVLSMMAKSMDAMQKAHDKAEKYYTELQVLRLELGDMSWLNTKSE